MKSPVPPWSHRSAARALAAAVVLLLALIGAIDLAARFGGAGSRASPAPDGAAAAGGNDHALTVAYWNLEWFPGHHPHASEAAEAAHVRAVTPVIARLDPDVLGLEEIRDRAAAQLAVVGLVGFKVDVCAEFVRSQASFGGGAAAELDHQQVVLCSRLPVLASGWQPWRPDANGLAQRRGLVFAIYRIAPGEAALVYGLHLKSNLLDESGGAATNVAMREEASRQLLAHERALVAAWHLPERLRLVIIGGDMNTSLDDPRFAAETTLRSLLATNGGGFLWGWSGVPEPRRLTLPAKGHYPAVCFDQVLYRPASGSPVRLVKAGMVETGPDASDHHPIWARLAW